MQSFRSRTIRENIIHGSLCRATADFLLSKEIRQPLKAIRAPYASTGGESTDCKMATSLGGSVAQWRGGTVFRCHAEQFFFEDTGQRRARRSLHI
ncbi:hypothetical protein KM043_000226 [Ampulex compressa]|nr:hypothetical protein KM043_000226 [Ampulex compressa]